MNGGAITTGNGNSNKQQDGAKGLVQNRNAVILTEAVVRLAAARAAEPPVPIGDS